MEHYRDNTFSKVKNLLDEYTLENPDWRSGFSLVDLIADNFAKLTLDEIRILIKRAGYPTTMIPDVDEGPRYVW